MGKDVGPISKGKQQMILLGQSSLCNLCVLLLLVQTCSKIAEAGSLVKFLPGVQGPLPFKLETGYIGVDESEEVQLFYYFIESESNPQKDPLLLWFSGGPGCTSLTGLVLEIGPIMLEPVPYDGSLPKLVLNPYAWTKVASIIFVDLPVETGFSYARKAKASHSTDTQACDQAFEFLRKWLVEHPEFISNPLYVGGDSYSGITVPVITQLISNGNEFQIGPKIDLKGYILGNPKTTEFDKNYKIPFAHGMGLISDELYKSLKVSCKGEYETIDPRNAPCLQCVQTFNQLISNIFIEQILEPNCAPDLRKPNKIYGGRRSTNEMFHQKIQELKMQDSTSLMCRGDIYRLLEYWANDENVQEALHVQKGSIGEWMRCNRNLPHTENVRNSVPYHANLSIKGYRSLIYSGDHDMVIPHLGTQAWIRSLNYSIIDDWRPWNFQDQVAGYTRTYANKMIFATVKAGGHCAPQYKPAECQAMFKRWISYQPL